jgi:hypothetical protein
LHRVSLAGTSNSIREDGSIDPFENLLHDWLDRRVEDLFLSACWTVAGVETAKWSVC